MQRQLTMPEKEVIEALQKNDLCNVLIKAIIREEAGVNFKLDSNRTLLSRAAKHCNNIETFNAILTAYGSQAQAAALATTKDRRNALHRAAYYGDTSIFQAVVGVLGDQAQVGALATTKDGCNALHLAARRGDTSMFQAVIGVLGHKAQAAALAIEKGGWNALHLAAHRCDTSMFQAVVGVLGHKAQAAALATMKDGWNALHIVAWNGDTSMVQAVIRVLGDQAQAAALAIQQNGCNALHIAARRGDISMVQAVISALGHKAQAAALATTKEGWNAVYFAARRATYTNDDSVVIELIKLVGLEQAQAIYDSFKVGANAKKQKVPDRLGAMLETLYRMAAQDGLVNAEFSVLPERARRDMAVSADAIEEVRKYFYRPTPCLLSQRQLKRAEALGKVYSSYTTSILRVLPVEILFLIISNMLDAESGHAYCHDFHGVNNVLRLPGPLFFQKRISDAEEEYVELKSGCALQ